MTGAEVQATFFSPFHFFVYLFVVLVIMIVYMQVKWARTADKKTRVKMIHADGSSSVTYVPKDGNKVEVINKDTGLVKMWPMSSLATYEEDYPGDALVPKFMQKKIRTILVDEMDMEPILNRSACKENVASPDVKAMLYAIAEKMPNEETKQYMINYTDNLKTAPTRELIASPAILGNINQEKFSEIVVTAQKDFFEPLKNIISKLGKQINPNIVYIGLGLIGILAGFAVYQIMQLESSSMDSVVNQLEVIKQALGIK